MPRLKPAIQRSQILVDDIIDNDEEKFVLQGETDFMDSEPSMTVKFMTVAQYRLQEEDPIAQLLDVRNPVDIEEFSTDEAVKILVRSGFDGSFIIDYLANFGLVVINRETKAAVAL